MSTSSFAERGGAVVLGDDCERQHCGRPRLLEPNFGKAETAMSLSTDPRDSLLPAVMCRRHLSGSDGLDFHADLSNLMERDRAHSSLGGVEQCEVDPLAYRAAINDTIIADFLNEFT